MHTLWKGSISFGLVNIPVKIHAVTESQEFKFHYLHNQCHQRIRYVKKCPYCNVDVGNGDIVKGYEFERDRYVTFSDEELESFKNL
jgi:DNA end-binding protein Ku